MACPTYLDLVGVVLGWGADPYGVDIGVVDHLVWMWRVCKIR